MSDNISGVIALDIVCFNLVIDLVNLQIKKLILIHVHFIRLMHQKLVNYKILLWRKNHISFVTVITTVDLNKFNSVENLNFRTFVLYMEFEKSDPITIDSLLNRVRLGKYQYWIYLVLGVHYICDGAEAIAISLLGGILQKEWNISNSQISSLGSAVFLGIFVGSVLSGLLSDYFGRKKIFMYSLFMSIITCFLSAFAPTYNTMLFIRALFGVSVGFIQPCFAAYIAEITPQDQRGRALSVVSMLFTVGELIGWFCARVFLDSYTSGKWRVLLFLGSCSQLNRICYRNGTSRRESKICYLSQLR